MEELRTILRSFAGIEGLGTRLKWQVGVRLVPGPCADR